MSVLTASAVENLAGFLESGRCPPDTLNYPALLGFLWAVAASPAPLEVEEWLPLVWEDEEGTGPAFHNFEEAALISATVVALYEDVVRQIEGNVFELPEGFGYDDDADRMRNLIDWCQGFLAGHDWLGEVWDQVSGAFDEASKGEFNLADEVENVLNTVNLFAGYPEILEHLEDPEVVRKDLPEIAVEVLPQALLAYARTGREFAKETEEA